MFKIVTVMRREPLEKGAVKFESASVLQPHSGIEVAAVFDRNWLNLAPKGQTKWLVYLRKRVVTTCSKLRSRSGVIGTLFCSGMSRAVVKGRSKSRWHCKLVSPTTTLRQ